MKLQAGPQQPFTFCHFYNEHFAVIAWGFDGAFNQMSGAMAINI